MHPRVLSSFRDGVRAPQKRPLIQAVIGSRTPVPAGEYRDFQLNTNVSDLHDMVHQIAYHEDELEFPTHINLRTGQMTAKHDDHIHMIMLDPLEQPPEDPMRDRVEI